MNKEEAIRVRITSDLKRRVKAIADRDDLKMSDIGRRALREFVQRDDDRLREEPPAYGKKSGKENLRR